MLSPCSGSESTIRSLHTSSRGSIAADDDYNDDDDDGGRGSGVRQSRDNMVTW